MSDTLRLDDLPVVESVTTPNGAEHKYSKKEIEDQRRGEAFRRISIRWHLLTSLRGLTLDEAIDAWREANGITGGDEC